MAVFTFANTKGGAGKTTAVALLASGLARRGARVEVIDADPQRWLSRWLEAMDTVPAGITARSFVSEINVLDVLEEARRRADHVIIDLPGAASQTMAICIAACDHVVIPIQGCAMDAEGGARVLEVIAYLKSRGGLDIAHSVMLSRVNPLVSTRALGRVKTMLAARGVGLLDVALVERAAYRDMFDHAVTLHALDPEKVSNLTRAIDNAEQFVDACLGAARAAGATAAPPRAQAA